MLAIWPVHAVGRGIAFLTVANGFDLPDGLTMRQICMEVGTVSDHAVILLGRYCRASASLFNERPIIVEPVRWVAPIVGAP